MIFSFFRKTTGAVRAINQKYATPHIAMTLGVKLALGVLRFYLLFLVGIMVYKFITLLR